MTPWPTSRSTRWLRTGLLFGCWLPGLLGAVVRWRSCWPWRFFHWRQFLFGVALGVLASAFVGAAVHACLRYPLLRAHNFSALSQALHAMMQCLGVAVFTYLVNFAFVALACRSSFYRKRMQDLLRLPYPI